MKYKPMLCKLGLHKWKWTAEKDLHKWGRVTENECPITSSGTRTCLRCGKQQWWTQVGIDVCFHDIAPEPPKN